MTAIPTRSTTLLKPSSNSSDSNEDLEQIFSQYSSSISKSSAEERLLGFVEEQIDKMQKYTNLGSPQGSPGWFELNNALMGFNNMQTSLIGLDVIAKQEAYLAEETLKDKQAEWYIEAREKLNPISLSAQKWYSTSELEAYVRVHHKDELHKLSSEANASASKVAVIRRLLDSMDKYALILSRLSKNLETETLAFANETKMNNLPI